MLHHPEFVDSYYFVVIIAIVVVGGGEVCMCVCFPSFDWLVWGYLFLVFSWVWSISLGWNFPSSTFSVGMDL